MTPERWEQLNALFHEASEAPPAERSRLLDARCADPSLRAEVERLLAAHDRAGQFIQVPAAATADWLETATEPPITGRRFGPYRIEREIGRGGMGAVYLAERTEGGFEQRVAVKLIKRGMDTELVLERFRAERQILASLEHPHIARLLDGGTSEEGRPYFVMEYVEGQPIDEYADAKHLAVRERLALFVEVCAAVVHAHEHRVVHRDIKPVNILVTPDGTPKLLDFGIAKVLSPEGEEITSSVTGLRLLTPEYASPEQVEGRHATPASDVYSLGVVLYELLTGKSPYRTRSRDPQEVADAVRTTDPERPSTAVTHSEPDGPRRPGLATDRAVATGAANTDRLGRQLRGDLDTIVMTALRKDPARRYPSVQEFAEDIRRHLDGRPVQARPDGALYRAGKFLRRNRVAALTAAVAAVVATGGVLAATSLRDRDRPAGPLLTATGALAARDRILVADLADQVGDPPLVAAVTDAFRVDLAQSSLVRVITARQVRSTLSQMQRSPDLALDDSLAREVALRQNVKAIVTGTFSRVAGRYTISLQMANAVSGDLLVALHESVEDSTQVIRTVDRLSVQLRRKMGESLRSVRATPPLEQVTTASLDALRQYTEGVRSIAAGDRLGGIRLLQKAVALDTGFASAWRLLGVTYGDMVEIGRERLALGHAVANQERLPFYERYHLMASYAMNVTFDSSAAITAFHQVLDRYPDDVRALNNLGLVYASMRRFAVQESLLVRALAADSTIPLLHTGLVMARTNAGDFAGARRALDEAERRFPGQHYEILAEIYLASSQQDWDTAERFTRQRLAKDPVDVEDPNDALETLSGILMTRGRLADAEAQSRRVLALAPKHEAIGRYLSSSIRLGFLRLRYRHDSAGAIALVDSALSRFPLDSLPEGDRQYDDLARLFAAAGNPARARALLVDADRSSSAPHPSELALRRWTLGVIALAEGKATEAVAELRRADSTFFCPVCVLPDLGRAWLAAHAPDSAIAVLDRYVRLPWEWRFETDGAELGFALQRIGELYTQRHQLDDAEQAYGKLVRLWGKADPELQPIVTIARLRSKPGKL